VTLKATEITLDYSDQQREATGKNMLLFRNWRDLAAKQKKQKPVTKFYRKKIHI
jgi:hypothetical protein